MYPLAAIATACCMVECNTAILLCMLRFNPTSMLQQQPRSCSTFLSIQMQSGAEMRVSCELILCSTRCAEKKVCPYSTPFVLLSDVCDSVTLDHCEDVFTFVEENISVWTKPAFFKVGRNQMLRMCNDLLRRLSASQNTVFCGRIQLFLARLFPLNEKSALNLMSNFNLENITVYSETPNAAGENGDEKMDTTLEASFTFSDGVVDYNLYEKLWSMQDFLRSPTQCFESKQWEMFTACAHDVLAAFDGYKLDDVARSSKRAQKAKKPKSKDALGAVKSVPKSPIHRSNIDSHYFAKFLTSVKLMNLQLSDCHFRRHILIQLLILFQYLTSNVKFKSSAHVLTTEQDRWLTDTTEMVYRLLEETPPDGAAFSSYIRHALTREENWISWKNEGCPSLVRSQVMEGGSDDIGLLKERHKQRLGDIVVSNKKAKRMDLGSPELTELWNKYPDSLQMCCSSERQFVPQVGPFLEEAAVQADPKEQVEEEFKHVKSANFAFQALRLLSRHSPYFFQSNAAVQIKALPDFLEGVVLQTTKDLKAASTPNGKPL